MTNRPHSAFREMAAVFERDGSPLYARLASELADDPVAAEIVSTHEPRWDAVIRLFAGVHLLALLGEEDDPWAQLEQVLRRHRDRLGRFVAEQPVQTNEVQRSWVLVPAFLEAAGSTGQVLDLVELGPSAGLNLIWDRHRYRYPSGSWGPQDAELELTGKAVGGPPARLLTRRPVVRRRLGIERSPVDLFDDAHVLLLQAFVWADQTDRLARLRRAIDLTRRDPPEIVRADYVEVLPDVLCSRARDGLTIVFDSASTGYLRPEERARLREEIAAAGAEAPLAWISYDFLDERGEQQVALDLTTWPGGEMRRLAHPQSHGRSMRWLA